MLLSSYGLKHISLYRIDHNRDHHYCGPAQVPLQCNIHSTSNVRARLGCKICDFNSPYLIIIYPFFLSTK
jgi:hypothetical protein